MSMTAPRRLVGGFRTGFVLFTKQAVTQTITGHPIFVGKTEQLTGRQL